MRKLGLVSLILATLVAMPTAGQAQEQAEIAQLQTQPQQQGQQSGFRVCNRSRYTIQVAAAVASSERGSDGRPIVQSQGWWTMSPSTCRMLYSPLRNRYYYVYAQENGNANRTWSGTYPVCVHSQAFNIRSTQCGQGYNRRNFHQVDTGTSFSGVHTHNFDN